MESFDSNESQNTSSQISQSSQYTGKYSNPSQDNLTICQSMQTCQTARKNFNTLSIGLKDCKNFVKTNIDDSFFSESDQIKVQQSLDDQLILSKKVEKRDIIFSTMHFKQSFVKYFTDVIYGFLKQPTDLTFSIALDRLKYYSEQTPFLSRNSKTESDYTDKQNSSFNSNDSEVPKSSFSNCKTTQSSGQLKIDFCQSLTVQNLLKAMLYQNDYQYMIYTFDYVFCHLTFIASMLFFWSKMDNSVSNQHLSFTRSSEVDFRKSLHDRNKDKRQQNQLKNNLFKTLKFYILQRSQSLNICQINILIVYFLLNYMKNCFSFEDRTKQITEIQQGFINNLKLYRRIRRMEKEFNSTSNHVIFQSQLHKYEYENKLIESMEKTFLIFQFLNTHNFVSSPLQKYFEIDDFHNSKKLYHLKRDYFCIWVIKIVLRLCEKKSAESLSKSAYYIITFLAILKKFKQNRNFQGIAMILPILFNIKEQLPKVWNHAQSRRKQINQKLKEYSQILISKTYKKEDIPTNCNAIISEDVIYQMCSKFEKYQKIDKNDGDSGLISVQKHKKFYEEFLVHIVYHRKQILEEYSDQIQHYKKERQIGISFNMYLLDTYVWRSYRGTNSKSLWSKLTQKSKNINEQMSYNIYIDIIDYCFVGSSLKYRQLQI